MSTQNNTNTPSRAESRPSNNIESFEKPANGEVDLTNEDDSSRDSNTPKAVVQVIGSKKVLVGRIPGLKRPRSALEKAKVVKETKDEKQVTNLSPAMKVYMAEVKKYKQTSGKEEGGGPVSLVK